MTIFIQQCTVSYYFLRMFIEAYCMIKRSLNILFIPSWFPSQLNRHKGIFIRKHAEVISRNNFVTVLNFDFDSVVKNRFFDFEDINESENLRILHFKIRKFNIPGNDIIKQLVVYFIIFYYILLKRIAHYDLINLNVVFHIGIYLFPFLYFSRKPIVITEHWTGYFEQDGAYSRLNFVFKKMITLLFEKSKSIIVISESLKKQLSGLFGSFNKLSIIPNVLNCPESHRLPSNLKNDKFSFLVISNFDNRQKRLTQILDAFSRLKHVNSYIKIIFAGDGGDYKMVVDYARGLNLNDEEAIFLGAVSNDKIPQLYSNAHCYVLNSYFETFSISTAEALLNGVPVIAPFCNGPEEYIDENNGILIDVNDNNSLFRAMSNMIANFEKYDSAAISKNMKTKYCDSLDERFQEVFLKV